MNNKIIVAVLFIGGTGVIRAFTENKSLTPVLLGSYILLLVLAIADMFGGKIAELSSAIATVAVIYVLLTQFPWNDILTALKGGKA